MINISVRLFSKSVGKVRDTIILLGKYSNMFNIFIFTKVSWGNQNTFQYYGECYGKFICFKNLRVIQYILIRLSKTDK